MEEAAHPNSTNPDLKRFQRRGGKVILYHGWSDAAIPASNLITIIRAWCPEWEQAADGFVRLFMVPGMQHCGGGSGPNSFGQGAISQGDPDHDINAALERWVEAGTAPERIIATKYKAGANPPAGVERTRPSCAFPSVARWKGAGSTDDAANFDCSKPENR